MIVRLLVAIFFCKDVFLQQVLQPKKIGYHVKMFNDIFHNYFYKGLGWLMDILNISSYDPIREGIT